MNQSDEWVRYNFEYDRKLRVCYIGAGGHSFRNILPTFQYAPVDFLAICDRHADRAAAYARQFGAARSYADHHTMLEREQPEAVFIVTSYTREGRVQATDLALDALRAGCHVWMEKPTAASTDEVRQLMAVSAETGRFVMTGLKKLFFPAVAKVKAIIGTAEFGRPTSLAIRYPQAMPAFEARSDLRNVTGLLDHIYHPAAIIHHLMGKIARVSYEWEPVNGSSVTSMQFQSGAVGTLHFSAGSSGSSPLERLEVIGEGANVVLENGVKLTYYRKASQPAYGRAPSFLVPDEVAPLHWEPEFSLGQLYNKNLFYLGYVPEVLHFCESVLAGTPLQKGTLEEALEIMKLFEVYCRTPAATTTVLN